MATLERQRIYTESDNYATLTGLQNTITGDYPTDATVLVTIINRLGNPVTGATDLPASYVAGTTDEETAYRALIDDTVVIAPGQYNGKVTATVGSLVRTFNVPVTVERG